LHTGLQLDADEFAQALDVRDSHTGQMFGQGDRIINEVRLAEPNVEN
jgi:hypothetical protein